MERTCCVAPGPPSRRPWPESAHSVHAPTPALLFAAVVGVMAVAVAAWLLWRVTRLALKLFLAAGLLLLLAGMAVLAFLASRA